MVTPSDNQNWEIEYLVKKEKITRVDFDKWETLNHWESWIIIIII